MTRSWLRSARRRQPLAYIDSNSPLILSSAQRSGRRPSVENDFLWIESAFARLILRDTEDVDEFGVGDKFEVLLLHVGACHRESPILGDIGIDQLR